ncbi:hypothetical protein ACQ4PT_034058 [Festuca glaucescens]
MRGGCRRRRSGEEATNNEGGAKRGGAATTRSRRRRAGGGAARRARSQSPKARGRWIRRHSQLPESTVRAAYLGRPALCEQLQGGRRGVLGAADPRGSPDRFSVEIFHNGFFSRFYEDLLYIDGSQDFFDNCNVDTWSILWIHHFLSKLGVQMDEKMQVFWCKAGKDFSEGLVYIENDADIVSMIEVARVHKTLSLFVDHTNFVKSLRSDVLTNGRTEEDVVELEQNASGRAVDNDHNASGRGVENERMDIDMADMAATCENKRRGKQSFDEAVDEETDSDFYDSDFDAEDGDDDIFLATVDRSVNDDNAPLEIIELEDDVGLENEDLQLTKEQKEELQYKFKQFNAEVDMEQPVFKTGMIFANVKELRAEITAYNMKERVKIKKVGNESGRIHVVCLGDCLVGNCSWFFKASGDNRKEAMVVKNYCGKHV